MALELSMSLAGVARTKLGGRKPVVQKESRDIVDDLASRDLVLLSFNTSEEVELGCKICQIFIW